MRLRAELHVSKRAELACVQAKVVGGLVTSDVQLWRCVIHVGACEDGLHDSGTIAQAVGCLVGHSHQDTQARCLCCSERVCEGAGQAAVCLFDVVADAHVASRSDLAAADGSVQLVDTGCSPAAACITASNVKVLAANQLVEDPSALSQRLVYICPAAEGNSQVRV
jgi:hypothetical protein